MTDTVQETELTPDKLAQLGTNEEKKVSSTIKSVKGTSQVGSQKAPSQKAPSEKAPSVAKSAKAASAV